MNDVALAGAIGTPVLLVFTLVLCYCCFRIDRKSSNLVSWRKKSKRILPSHYASPSMFDKHYGFLPPGWPPYPIPAAPDRRGRRRRQEDPEPVDLPEGGRDEPGRRDSRDYIIRHLFGDDARRGVGRPEGLPVPNAAHADPYAQLIATLMERLTAGERVPLRPNVDDRSRSTSDCCSRHGVPCCTRSRCQPDSRHQEVHVNIGNGRSGPGADRWTGDWVNEQHGPRPPVYPDPIVPPNGVRGHPEVAIDGDNMSDITDLSAADLDTAHKAAELEKDVRQARLRGKDREGYRPVSPLNEREEWDAREKARHEKLARRLREKERRRRLRRGA
ncbi:hypothetical protein LTR17_001665 [Elasticomyces elasticus]|nr:hypothetical protein LTR17_001665 [Elasticomyces elasticus]